MKIKKFKLLILKNVMIKLFSGLLLIIKILIGNNFIMKKKQKINKKSNNQINLMNLKYLKTLNKK